jgi:hypothetical protein
MPKNLRAQVMADRQETRRRRRDGLLYFFKIQYSYHIHPTVNSKKEQRLLTAEERRCAIRVLTLTIHKSASRSRSQPAIEA